MSLPKIIHLVDDTSAGGVTRFLNTIRKDSTLAETAKHEVLPVARGRLPMGLSADVIVSHLSVSWRTLPSLVALRARYAHLPLVHIEHSYSEGFVAAKVRNLGRFHCLLRTAYALFDRVVAVSHGQAKWLRDTGLVTAEALTVISPCVDLDPFLAMPKHSGPVRRLGAIGRYDGQKGFDLLIRAFLEADTHDMTLDLIGSGPDCDDLVALAQGDARIRFHPFTADPAAAMAELDAVLMPSRWEPYGLVALEARAAGRLLVANRIDGLNDHVEAGAIAVADPTVEHWAEAIEAMQNISMPRILSFARDDAAGAGALCVRRWNTLLQGLLTKRNAPELLEA